MAKVAEERRRGGGRRRSDRVRVLSGKKGAVVVAAEEERKRPQVSISPAGAVVGDGRRAGDGCGDKRRVGFLGCTIGGLKFSPQL